MWLVKFKSSPPVWSPMPACDTITVHDSLKPSAHTLCSMRCDSILCVYICQKRILKHTHIHMRAREIIRPVFSSGALVFWAFFYEPGSASARCDFETLANPNVQTSGSESCCWQRADAAAATAWETFFLPTFLDVLQHLLDGIWMRKVAFSQQNLKVCVAHSSKIYFLCGRRSAEFT